MCTKDAVREIWSECFDDTPQWLEMFFSKVYRDDDAVTLECDNRPVSSLMLQQYAMNFHGEIIPAGYICGAATLGRWRDKGYMSRLMEKTLRKSYDRGDMICALIPAEDILFRFYERFGFSPAFYINLEHYTSAHRFSPAARYTQLADTVSDEAYMVFNDLMMRRPCCIQHSPEQWEEIVMDNSVDGGTVSVLTDSEGKGAAVVLAVPTDSGEVRITDLLARDADSRLGALALIREIYGNVPIEVYGYFSAPEGREIPRGSVRIVNVYKLLRSLASSYPAFKAAIKVSDKLLSQNSHIYIVDRGTAVINDGYRGTIDYDIDIEVLTSMIFGNDVTRRLLNFPATRPFISLMLD